MCKDVGKYQLDNLGRRDLAIDKKTSSVDLVTEVDKASEKIIISFLRSKYPEHNILAEEGGNVTQGNDFTWIIDPVDGTTNYAHGYPLFAIAIGLKQKDETIMGCIYQPVLDEFFWAIKDEGAYLNGKRITVSKAKDLDCSVVATGFPYNKRTSKHNNLDYFTHVALNLGGVRRSGSACVDLISVACGRIDGYFEMYLNPWDYVPGQLIIREAGGICEDKSVRGRYSIVATNGLIHKELCGYLAAVGTEDYCIDCL